MIGGDLVRQSFKDLNEHAIEAFRLADYYEECPGLDYSCITEHSFLRCNTYVKFIDFIP